MEEKLKLRIFSVLFLTVLITIFLGQKSFRTESNNITNDSYDTKEYYIIKIVDSKVSLLKENIIIKSYDIQPSILPGEDIKILSEGIIVDSVSEADRIAEDFDG